MDRLRLESHEWPLVVFSLAGGAAWTVASLAWLIQRNELVQVHSPLDLIGILILFPGIITAWVGQIETAGGLTSAVPMALAGWLVASSIVAAVLITLVRRS